MTPLERASEKCANILRNMGIDKPEDISLFFAIAALQAIREPSEAMRFAGGLAGAWHDTLPSGQQFEVASEVFTAMIDAALEEG